MRKEEIIAKGAYTVPQFGELISVRQFIIARQKGEKQLLLRLRNDRAEQADAVSFRVKQYDAKGNLVGTEVVSERGLAAKGGADFSLENPIKLNRACIDFTVEMLCAEYGDYTYHLHDGKLTASYESRSEELPLDKEKIAKQLRGRSGRVTARSVSAPRLLVASMALILLVIGTFAFLQLKNFMATEEFFTLENVEYRFETANHTDGPISIVGYTGKAGTIIIPESIEGHPIVGIADGAFEGKALRSVTVLGSPYIGQRAFADCPYMDAVTMENVTEIGAGAFADCRDLKDLTLSSELTVIPASAFAGCSSLKQISLPDGLQSLGDGAFAGCEKLTEIVIPTSLTDMGEGVFKNCKSVTNLTSPYAGMDRAGQNGIGYFFGGSVQIPDSLQNVVLTHDTALQDGDFDGCDHVLSITLPDAMTEIGANSFNECARLETIHLPEQLTVIGAYAFDGCGKLANVQLPASVTEIGAGAFRGCAALTNVTVPAGVKTLAENVFAACTGLESVTLPAELEAIQANAFLDCSGLTALEIPASVSSMQSNILVGCTGLETLTVPFLGETPDIALPLSHLLGDTTHGLKTLTVQNAREITDHAFLGFDALTTVSLADNTERIGERAFETCASLQTVRLPDAITEIGAYAFSGCSSLSFLQLPAGLTVIREGLFTDCTALRDVLLPATLTTVETRAFAGCTALTDAAWLSKIVSMGEYVFENCTALETVTLPTKITVIPAGTFSGCTALHTVAMPSTTTVIGERAFYDCVSLKNAAIPGKTQEIQKEAFANCESLTSVNLPSAVKTLGDEAFAGCASLRTLTVPVGVTLLGQDLVARCSSLETLAIPYVGQTRNTPNRLTYLTGTPAPESLTSVVVTNATHLADGAFQNYTHLESIGLNVGLQTIGVAAFQSCTALSNLSLPDTVTTIGEKTFVECRSLKTLRIPASVTRLHQGMLEGCTALETLSIPFIGESRFSSQTLSFLFAGKAVPSTLSAVTLTNARDLAAYAFEDCRYIDSITLACDLTDIGNYAFVGCTSLQSLSIPNTVTHIGTYAFSECSGLQKLTIPQSVMTLGYAAFYRCTGLTELTLPFAGTSRSNGSTFAELFGDTNRIPASLSKVVVTDSTSVADNAFSNCSGIDEIIYESDVLRIGNSAFMNCTSLTGFSMPGTVTSIGSSAFSGCSGIKEIAIPSRVLSIGDNAFSNCDSLTTAQLPNSVESVGAHAFYSCDQLTSVTVGSKATYIGYAAFAGCNRLAELTVPFVGGTPDDTNGLAYWFGDNWNMPATLKKVTVTNSTAVKTSAFRNLQALEEVVYTQSITAVGDSAFYGCRALRQFTLPDTVASIGRQAFYDCSALTVSAMPAGLVSIGDHAFYNCDGLTEIVIPDGILTVGAYAFQECGNLISATVGGSATSIGQYAFRYCDRLAELTVPFVGGTPDDTNGLAYWFGDNWNIPSSLTKITVTNSTAVKSSAFYNVGNLREIVYTQGVTDIGDHAFYNCSGLTEFVFPDSIRTIGDNAFYNCDGLTEIVIPDGIETIGPNAFRDCSQLTSVTVGATATSIGRYVFRYCNSLAELTVPFVGGTPDDTNGLSYWFESWNMPVTLKKVTVTNSTTVTNYAFQDCNYLEEVVYTRDVTSIGYYAFYNCSALKTLDLGDAIETIREYAFASCRALRSFTSPATCQSVSYNAFSWSYALYEVYNESSLVFNQWDGTGLRDYCLVYRDDDSAVKRLFVDGFELILADNGSWYVVDYVGESNTLIFPSHFTDGNTVVTNYHIAPYAFYNRRDIHSVTLPAAVTEIGNEAFWGCEKLCEIYNLSPLTIIKGNSDHGCVAYYAYIVHTSETEEALNTVQIGDFEFLKSDDTWFLVGYHGQGGAITLDAFTYGGKPISYTVIKSAFQNRYDITSLTITSAVIDMEANAFQSLGALEYLYIEANPNLTRIPQYAFAWCYNLKQVTLPSTLTEIAYNAFWECTSLREIYNLSALELTIGSGDHGAVAYYAYIIHDSLDDPALTEVRVNDLVFLNSGDTWLLVRYEGSEAHIVLDEFTYNGKTVNAYAIMNNAFSNNNTIESVEIGNAVKSIGRYAFNSCTKLQSVSFEENTSITTILPYTFAYNRNLDRVVLPASLTEIQHDAFWDCINLFEIYNLSSIVLTPGDNGNGSVAAYAKAIYTSMDEVGLGIVNMDYRGCTYKFMQENGEWRLYYRNQHTWYDGYINLPELVINGETTPYRVAVSLSDSHRIIVSVSVAYLDLNTFNGDEILYGGTAEEFAALTEGFDTSRYTVRYYADCVHNNNQWSYDDNGNIMLGINYACTVIKDPTCNEKGILRYTCGRCRETWEQETEHYGSHDMSEDLTCRLCGAQFESRPLEDMWAVTNDAFYPFDITGVGEIVSTNKEHGQSATMTLQALQDTVFSYHYFVSTESGCDVLIIRHNGAEITYDSGTYSGNLPGPTLEIAAGDIITITYSKDGSVHNGDDTVKVLNLVYLVEEAGDDNA